MSVEINMHASRRTCFVRLHEIEAGKSSDTRTCWTKRSQGGFVLSTLSARVRLRPCSKFRAKVTTSSSQHFAHAETHFN